jgi:hypothetical protein
MSKINRNDPCSCGSGKKFKKCCENKGKLIKIGPQLPSNSLQEKTLLLFAKKTKVQENNQKTL